MGSRVYKLQFNNIPESYYGGNGLTYDGFVGLDTYTCLSGEIIYSGTSQGSYKQGNYTIIPSGFSSFNYSITFITGTLNIQTSILNPPQNLFYNGYITPIILNPYISKNYDGLNSVNLPNLFAPNDQVYYNIYYSSNQAGYNIPLLVSIGGIDASNYMFSTISGNIIPLSLSLVSLDKTYDGLIDAPVSLVGLINNDSVYPPYAYFSDPEVGTDKVITISGTIYGSASNNYELVTTSLTGNIKPFSITNNI
jgi:hypothetical protein